ncbi:hypothetical protein BCU68_15600 [Vibrio sp. 10N.286.49.B3]|uniref:Lcl C-terminal domain-containing protein n=1 Tax=Vibrio sp. 10N.286.49.B3 TaxID=1880855 RepID=UPI000C82F4E5|nr:DUF1566 domain-containing protein [Vibrio sp. 10N.286.49.B3]PMH41384.1 hypothetical protein BCU68_15600 [Vibrio sp. 10N.286.49.B3]
MKLKYLSSIIIFLIPFAAQAQMCKSEDTKADTHFLEIEPGIILDQRTNLEWQKCTVGFTGPDCKGGNIQTFSQETAFNKIVQINNQSQHKWRLPTIEELATLVKNDCVAPAIDIKAFPNTLSSWYWSSTADYSYYGYVDFSVGYIGEEDMYLSNPIRLVKESEKK